MINRFSQLAPDLPKVMRSPSVKPDDAWRKFVGSPPGEASMFPRWETWEIHWETVGFSLYIYIIYIYIYSVVLEPNREPRNEPET